MEKEGSVMTALPGIVPPPASPPPTSRPSSGPVAPVVPKPVPPPSLYSTGLLVKCILTESKPSHVVVDNHACTKQVYTARFRDVVDERNSHPTISIEINSLTPLPYVVKELYTLSLEPAK
jgi:hypothetical protein